ncbi:DNA cytosine methyltransferase [Paenibacillus polysaccharolyticus]|uniref:DNA cytosine methyltransferase n=1 Tax=Paenibacillus polysaccharolyticus TaxID=582692 RepID=UPI00203F8DA4|nr:DNA cytosine methyltransferase [Paenibacillus polysaccharolyticus]MCM3131270.1 DNA cytosine methyltransferase [Paenibacillus polysaccharolyticus]
MALSIFSFFSGSGLLDLGFEQNDLNYNIVLVNEFNKVFLDAYASVRSEHNKNDPIYGYHCCDINDFLNTNLRIELQEYLQEQKELNNIVGFIGGPPCPDFSVGGKNKGREGLNGVLARSYIDLIISQLPDFFLFENVRGLVRTAKHRLYFNELKESLTEAGYIISTKVINSLSYGVPQDRDRVIMVGILNNADNPNVPVTDDGELEFPWYRYSLYDADFVKSLNWPTEQIYREKSRRKFKYAVPEQLTVQHWFERNNVRRHPNAKDVFNVKEGRGKMLEIKEGDTSGKSFKRLHRWKYSPTAAYGNNEVHLHPYETRRLSVSEVMAIQSLPPSFVLPKNMPKTHKFKTVGNGVPYLMSLAIAKSIQDLIHDIFYRGE